MEKTKFTNFILLALSGLGGFLVSEQVISGDQLLELQGIVGMALTGGGVTAFTIIALIKTVIPTQTAKNIINNIGVDNVNKLLSTVDKLETELIDMKESVKQLTNELQLERQAKNELGVYDNVSQDTKDKLGL